MKQLDESLIRALSRELLAQPGKPSGRALRRELKSRYGLSGKTQRIFAVWREEQQAAHELNWQRRLAWAENEVRGLREQIAQLHSQLAALRGGLAD